MDLRKIYFMLMVQNKGRAVAFYNSVMGLEFRVHSGNWSELGSEVAVVALQGGGRIIDPPEERAGEGITRAPVADPEGSGLSLTRVPV